MRVLMFLSALLLLAATVTAGNVYIWKDESGELRYSDKPPAKGDRAAPAQPSPPPPPPPQVERQPLPKAPPPAARQERKAPAQAGEIEVFVTDWCPYCDKAIAYLKSKGLKFKTYNIEKDKRAAKRKQELSKGRGGVPFAMIYGRPVLGFSPQAYDEALNQGR